LVWDLRANTGEFSRFLLDLTNPSPALGWRHRERAAFAERGPAHIVLGWPSSTTLPSPTTFLCRSRPISSPTSVSG